MLILTGEKDTEKSSPTSVKTSPLSVRFQDLDFTNFQESDGNKVSGIETSVDYDITGLSMILNGEYFPIFL